MVVVREKEIMDAYVAAHLYYEVKLTQGEVAQKMEVSRPTVSKLLSRAYEEGIVSIAVRRPNQRDLHLQSAFVDTLGLEAAAVVPGAPKSANTREILLAQGTIQFLKERLSILPQIGYVGLGWGRAILALVKALERTDLFLGGSTKVVPLIGGSGQSLEIFQINEMVRRVANALGSQPCLLHAPAMVANTQFRDALLTEPSVGSVVEAWRKLDVVVVGIGKRLNPGYRHSYIADYLKDEFMMHTAVGDVCSHYFDAEGHALGEEHEARLITVGSDQLKRTPLTIGVASGTEKVAAMVAAARAGLINALVTDEETAISCLQLAEAA